MRLRPALLALTISCGAGLSPAGPGIPGGPVPPPKGTPTGKRVTFGIGPAGGIAALDGLTVTIPEGALTTTVVFELTEVTASGLIGGVGNAFRIDAGGAQLALPATLTFSSTVDPATLTAAYQAAIGYWYRVYSVSRDASSVSVQTTTLGDWSLVTVATQRDLTGPFTISSTQAIPFSAHGDATLQFLGDDGQFVWYAPVGTITLDSATKAGGFACTPAGPATIEMPVSIAEIRESPLPVQFRWGINGFWYVSCADGSSDYVSTNFDSLGITNIGCLRTALGQISTDGVSETYTIDCGAGGSITATWNLTTPGP